MKRFWGWPNVTDCEILMSVDLVPELRAAAALSISARTRKKWWSAVPLQQKIWR